MKIKLITIMASPAGCYPAGAVVDLPVKQAMEIVRGGFAISLESKKEVVVEVATAAPVIKTAVKPVVKEIKTAAKKTATKKKGTVTK